jgi:glycerol-3-phosphate dehydrogenase (NAD(P)+)
MISKHKPENTSEYKSMKITVFGCGTWGGVMANYLYLKGHDVSIWQRKGSTLNHLVKTRQHPKLTDLHFQDSIDIQSNISVGSSSDLWALAVPSSAMRTLVRQLKEIYNPNQLIVNLTKGLEEESLMTMSEVISEELNADPNHIVSLYGPSHAEEVFLQLPTTLVCASKSIETATTVRNIFSSSTLRIYSNSDVLGVELGGSLKNVIAIAAGICDGIGFGDNTKAALMVRGSKEIARLGKAMHASELTFHGLSGIGDLIVTCISKYSRNRFVGEEIGKGKSLKNVLKNLGMIAEGVTTAKSVMSIQNKYKIELPICSAVFDVLFENKNPKTAVTDLMNRSLRHEEI